MKLYCALGADTVIEVMSMYKASLACLETVPDQNSLFFDGQISNIPQSHDFSCQQNVGDKTVAEDPSKDPQYAEPAVDNMREQKDKVLLRVRHRQWVRRARQRREEQDRKDSFENLGRKSGVW